MRNRRQIGLELRPCFHWASREPTRERLPDNLSTYFISKPVDSAVAVKAVGVAV